MKVSFGHVVLYLKTGGPDLASARLFRSRPIAVNATYLVALPKTRKLMARRQGRDRTTGIEKRGNTIH